MEYILDEPIVLRENEKFYISGSEFVITKINWYEETITIMRPCNGQKETITFSDAGIPSKKCQYE